MPTLSSFFQSLKETKTQYVVLSGFAALPSHSNDKIVVLVERLSRFLELEPKIRKIEGQRYAFPLNDEADNPQEIEMYIIPKGMGFYPDRFETELLSRVEWHNDIIRIPENTVLSAAILYWLLFRDSWLAKEPERRKVLRQFVEDRVGPAMPCRLAAVPFYSR
jgi:hypothetical protein